MKKFTLKDIAIGQESAKASGFNQDLFLGDREQLEVFTPSAYGTWKLIAMDNQHDKGEHDKMTETVVTSSHDGSEFTAVTGTTTSFNGETQVSFTEQQLTLKGFVFLTKESKEDFTDVYNAYLESQGYQGLTIDEIKSLGELNSEYNCTTLRFKDDEENMHYLTVNARNQLSSVTVKLSGREAKPSGKQQQSAFDNA